MCLQVLALAVVVMVGVWMGSFNGGFAWHDNVYLEFNYHPLFMILGLIFLYGNGTQCHLQYLGVSVVCMAETGLFLVGCHISRLNRFPFCEL